MCELLDQPQPAEADSAGERYAFQKHVGKVYGGKGFAEVWLRDHFAWEYKGDHKDHKRAYGWPVDLPRQEILSRLLALNHKRAAAPPAPPS